MKANGEPGGSWSNSDPAVFIIYINESKRMDGDFQLCSFYGANQTVKMLQVCNLHSASLNFKDYPCYDIF